MNTHTVSPLQSWLEVIHDYLNKDEIIKARFASLILPIFETMDFFSVMRKICFKSFRLPEDSVSNLIFKASCLAFNIFFSGYKGFRDPRRNYHFHKDCGLVAEKVFLSPPLNKEEEEEFPVENDLSESDQEGLTSEKEAPVIPSESQETDACEQNVEHLIQQLQSAPLPIEKKHVVKDAIKKCSTRFDHFITRGKGSESKKERSSLPASFLPHTGEQNPSADESSDDVLVAEAKVLPSSEIANKAPSEESQARLKAIMPLIEKTISQKGSWKVQDKHIYYQSSASFHIDPAIIDVLAEAETLDYFSSLTLDQIFILNQNLKIMDSSLATRKSNLLVKWLLVNQKIENQLVQLWIQEDYQQGKFYSNCHQLIQQIVILMQTEKESSETFPLRLFVKPSSAPLVDIFESWQYSAISKQLRFAKRENPLTLHDYQEILKAYLVSLPIPIRQKWKALKLAQNQEEWLQAIQKLPPEDKQLVNNLLNMLGKASDQIWKDDVPGLLKAMKELTVLICSTDQLNHPDVKILSEILMKNRESPS